MSNKVTRQGPQGVSAESGTSPREVASSDAISGRADGILYQDAATYLVLRLVNCPIDEIITVMWQGLGRLARVIGAKWGNVLERDPLDDTLHSLIEWRPGQAASCGPVGKLSMEALARHLPTTRRRMSYVVPVAVFPDGMPGAKAYLQRIGVSELVVAPIMANQQPMGALVFGRDETGQDIDLGPLRVFARLYGQAVARLQGEQRDLERRASEAFLGELGADLVSCGPGEIDRVIARHLPRLGELTGVERIRLATLRQEGREVQTIHEWCSKGIPPSPVGLTRFPSGPMEPLLAEIRQGGSLELLRSDPPSHPWLRAVVLDSQVQSLLFEPLMFHGRMTGYLGYHGVTAPTRWREAARGLARHAAHLLCQAMARRQAHELLARRADFDRYLSSLATDLIDRPTDQLDAAIQEALTAFGRMAKVDRVALLLVDDLEGRLQVTHGWAASGVRRIGLGPVSSVAEMPHWWQTMESQGLMVIDDLEELPPQAAGLAELLRRQGAVSGLSCALRHEGRVIGFVGLHAVQQPRHWEAIVIEQTQALARTLAHAIVRRQTDQRLQASERRLRSFLDAISEPAFVIDRDLRFLLANDAIASRLGQRPDKLLGKYCLAGFDADIVASREDNLRRVIATGETMRFDDDRAGRHYVNTVYPIKVASGEVTALAVVAIDITARRHAESALLESEANLRRALSAARMGIWALDTRTGAVQVSDLAARILGLDPQTLPKRYAGFEELFALADHAERLQRFDQDLDRDGQAHAPVTLRRPDGEMVSLRVYAETVLDDDGNIERVVGVFQDVTAVRRLQQQAARAERSAAVAGLAGRVAHDFAHYLTVISVAGDLLRLQVDADSAAACTLDQLMIAWQDAAALVRGLQTLSGQEAHHPQPVSLDRLVGEALPHLQALIPEPVSLTLRLHAPDLVVRADEAQLRRVLLNLVSNASRALEQSDGPKGIEIETCRQAIAHPLPCADGYVPAGVHGCVLVRDNGVGMTEEQQSRLFEPLSGPQRAKGHGLGMAIVEGIITQHGGRVCVTSAPGEGTTISLFLPLEDD